MGERDDSALCLSLQEGMFQPQRQHLLTHGGIGITSFRYPSGVAALEVETPLGRVVLLPFQGQQIWDAEFRGRRLTMETWFDQPVPTRDYMRTYGAFFLHCGGTAMGNPAPEDTHPLHGELPNIAYERAALRLGRDAAGAWVELTGRAVEKVAFTHHFDFEPCLRLHEARSDFELSFEVHNRAASVLPFHYLAHVNFRPQAGGRLIDALEDDKSQITLRRPILPEDAPQEVRAWHEAVAQDPSRHRAIDPERLILPEMVMTLQPPADSDGWVHAMQLLPDGSADYVSHRAEELPYLVRWTTCAPDRKTQGFSLPATSPPDGKAAAMRNRQYAAVPPGGRFRAHLRFGALSAPEATALAMRLKGGKGN